MSDDKPQQRPPQNAAGVRTSALQRRPATPGGAPQRPAGSAPPRPPVAGGSQSAGTMRRPPAEQRGSGVRSAPAAGGGKDTPATRADFLAFLTRLCERAGLQGADVAMIVERQQMLFNETNVAFQLQEDKGRVKIFIDVGPLPTTGATHPIFRRLLEQHLYFDAPFRFLLSVHPVSHRIILFAHAPLPYNSEDDAKFISIVEEHIARSKALAEEIN